MLPHRAKCTALSSNAFQIGTFGTEVTTRPIFNRYNGVAQVRVTPKTRNPFTIFALSIPGVTWKWHFLNHAVSDAVIRRWGAISGAVKRATGHSPSVIDSMLAATAIEHDLYFVTRNVRDVQHSGAAVFNPWTDDPAAFRLRAGSRRTPK